MTAMREHRWDCHDGALYRRRIVINRIEAAGSRIWNPRRLKNSTRVTQEEAVAHEVTALMGFPDDEGTQQGEQIATIRQMAEMRLVTIDQATVISRRGSCGPFSGSVAPVVDDGGAVLGAVFVFHQRVPGDRHLLHRTHRRKPSGERRSGWEGLRASSNVLLVQTRSGPIGRVV